MPNKFNFAMEATAPVSGKLLNEGGEPMKIALITDKIIMEAKLQKVTNPIMFDRNRVPTIDGLFSPRIFGETADDQKRTLAYIDLQEKFFHPYVFEVLKRLKRGIEKCASGEGVWFIDKGGELTEIKDETDPRWDEDASGVRWLIDHFHEIKFAKNNSNIRNERVTFIESLDDSQLFISTWLVVPKFYRDVEVSNGRQSIPEINYSYTKLMQYSNALKDDIFSFYNNKARYSIQMTLYNIRRYGQELIQGKNGFFHKSVMGKSVERGSRDVISVPVMENFQRPEDNPVDIYHSGIPLAKCLVLGYDFVLRYCLNFFKDNFSGSGAGTLRVDMDGSFVAVKDANLVDQTQIFTKAYLDKRINEYINSHATRFDLITVKSASGRDFPVRMSGRYSPLDTHNPKASTILDRPMTWTDLFFIAAMETLSDKHVYITRYPLTDYSGSYPSLCLPLSTIRTQAVTIAGTVYANYPIIDINMKPDEVATQFIDTVTMSNLYLSALGGD